MKRGFGAIATARFAEGSACTGAGAGETARARTSTRMPLRVFPPPDPGAIARGASGDNRAMLARTPMLDPSPPPE